MFWVSLSSTHQLDITNHPGLIDLMSTFVDNAGLSPSAFKPRLSHSTRSKSIADSALIHDRLIVDTLPHDASTSTLLADLINIIVQATDVRFLPPPAFQEMTSFSTGL
jgi:hypothetical protein